MSELSSDFNQRNEKILSILKSLPQTPRLSFQMSAERDSSGILMQTGQVLDVDRLESKREYATQIDDFYKIRSIGMDGMRDGTTPVV